jgi:hypothetical protein
LTNPVRAGALSGEWTAPCLSRRSSLLTAASAGLDWFAFFLADIQTGWGPFVAVYLTSKQWTQFDIGLILTIGTLAAIALQIPSAR